jgi:DNA-binding NarL/FixJ family response regulator
MRAVFNRLRFFHSVYYLTSVDYQSIEHNPLMPAPKILVVEDFEQFRRFVVSTLQQSADFQIVEASDGLEALQKVEEQQPDLVLLDIGLPNLNGMEVARRLRELAGPPKIVFLSQESSPEVIGETLNLGALGYVHKTRAGSDLLPAIQAALEGRRFINSGLQVGVSTDPQPRHEILFSSDAAALLSILADFVADALKSGNAAFVRAIKSRGDGLYEELQRRGIEIDTAMQRGTYAFLDVDEPFDRSLIPDVIRHLSEAACKEGKTHPRVAFWGERPGRMWADGNTEEAIRVERLANELAKGHNVDVVCPYPLPSGEKDQSAFEKICKEHSVISFR